MFEDDDGEGLRAKLGLTGEIHLRTAAGEVVFDAVEVRCRGTFGEPAAPFRVKLEGKRAEVEKLAALGSAFADMLAMVPAPPETLTSITLEAPPEHLARLAEAGKTLADPLDPQAYMQNAPCMQAVFDLARYRVLSVGTVTRISN